MHYTGTVYRNPYEPPSPLLEITQGCSHNKCKFCNMYSDVKFQPSPMEWIEEDIKEIASVYPRIDRLQLLSADSFVLSFERLDEICDLIHEHLPNVKIMTMAARVDNIRDKTVDELEILKSKGIVELNLGAESGDDETLKSVKKGYTGEDILEQCEKLDEAGIDYWLTFLNGAGGVELSRQHAINSAKIFSQANPTVVGTGGLVLFEGTGLAALYKRGKFNPLSEKGLMEELKIFIENLDFDGRFITHHTISMDLNNKNFKDNKEKILKNIQYGIDNLNMDRLTEIRNNKRTL
ncbi:MAG: radical SAM protein [Methanobrevibacter sp.]|nr:radical SAM protein [Methanobrevibacter sp.]